MNIKLPFSRSGSDERGDGPGRKLPSIKLPPILTDSRLFMALGLGIVLMMTVMLFTGSAGDRDFVKAQEQAERAKSQVSERIQAFRRLLEDEQVRALADMAIADPTTTRDLQQYLTGRMREAREVRLYFPQDYLARPEDLGEPSWIILDMLMTARTLGASPIQVMTLGEASVLAGMIRLGGEEDTRGYLLVTADPEMVLTAFDTTMPVSGYIALVQNNGRHAATTLREFGSGPAAGQPITRLPVAGSLFQLLIPGAEAKAGISDTTRLVLFVLGAVLLAFGLMKRRREMHPLAELVEDPAQLHDDREAVMQTGPDRAGASPAEPGAPPAIEPPTGPEVPLGDLPFAMQQRQRGLERQNAPVELTEGIFRAYDIRGIVGETLDADIARQVGQAVGTEALVNGATPVVVARDGRHSGPDLVKGMIGGIASTGCDVIDIGAVPTGVLYYAAFEAGSGSGVMVTGSHNPPDYNGFKVLIGGETLAQDRITALYKRLHSGELRIGKGKVTEQDRLDDYRERIASDIQLARPLKVVADCGNGIGGVCAADVLRAIGADVLPLFDDVDGDFPNHHPDPSDPHNLEDLIDSVRLMKADIGVAFDGDADRLGVVTPDGEIIFSDRLMMLYAREVLSRNPGAKIIYDVKCTGRLDSIIRNAGGEPEMYKTGHSLIKNRMKEVDAPFAGEMSGHFFFKDRWYGFDCGIYSAARLLEILAMDERSPEQVLGSLPSSISTPELKVHMQEGENHAFVTEFQQKARFADARVTTIDGLRADFDYGWGLVRASNTTPILVVRFEADSKESLQIIKEAFRMQMLSIRSDLELPF